MGLHQYLQLVHHVFYTQRSVLFYKSLCSNVNPHISKALSVDIVTDLFEKYDDINYVINVENSKKLLFCTK